MALRSPGRATVKAEAIKELQRFKTSVVNGAAAATNIPVAGITTSDTIQSVLMFAAGVPSSVTSAASITSNGNIQLAAVNSTGNVLVVNWWDRSV